MKIKDKQVWTAPPDHPGIRRKSPGGALEFDGSRKDQTAVPRLLSSSGVPLRIAPRAPSGMRAIGYRLLLYSETRYTLLVGKLSFAHRQSSLLSVNLKNKFMATIQDATRITRLET
ncbi:hypothetical protein TNCV_173931 [Trichonephila clavipes]|nr:hypothetical protein TNCV_173931 [Trichonephila clavipes]